jgi:hypothetical protein
MQIWEVYGSSGLIEGRAAYTTWLRFTSEQVARAAAEHPAICEEFGVMGCGPLQVREVEVHETLETAILTIRRRRRIWNSTPA